MRETIVNTNGKCEQTGKLMHQMVDKYYHDMIPFADRSLSEVFNLIKNIPFREDPPGRETLMRPRHTMLQRGYGGDCDDKCIALASYAKIHGIPYRFIAVRRPGKKNFHHVLCELYISGMWVHADPTYSFNTLSRQREHYADYKII